MLTAPRKPAVILYTKHGNDRIAYRKLRQRGEGRKARDHEFHFRPPCMPSVAISGKLSYDHEVQCVIEVNLVADGLSCCQRADVET